METLRNLRFQDSPPTEVIVSIVKDTDFGRWDFLSSLPFPVKVIFSEPGLTRQRNSGIRELSSHIDVVSLIDDDVLLHPLYNRHVLAEFEQHPACVALMGHLISNGDADVEEGKRLLSKVGESFPKGGAYFASSATWGSLYGCNMNFRREALEAEMFDERLPLYSEMEDTDMGTRIRRHGEVGYSFRCIGVHLRTPIGRINYKMRGFSQIMNAWYLCRKGSIPFKKAAPDIFLKRPAGNFIRMFASGQFSKRKAMLSGNLFALGSILRGRVDPELILRLK